MKTKSILAIVVMFLVITIASGLHAGELTAPENGENYKSLWKRVEKLNQAGKPRSALKIVGKIQAMALKEQKGQQIIKTVAYQSMLESSFKENPLLNSIRIFRESFQLSGDPVVQAFLHSLLAENYYNYYKRNRWRINERTESFQDTTQDVEQWSAKRFIKESIKHYRASVKNTDRLAKTPLKEYDLIVNRDKKGKTFYRNVFDLLANRALTFYEQEPVPLVKAGGMSSLNKPQLFKAGDEFLSIAIKPDKKDYRLLSMDIYQQLFRIHKNDSDLFLKVMFDLQRLEYLKKKSFRPDAKELYRFALENLLEDHSSAPVSTQVQYKLAQWWDSRADKYDPLSGDDHKMDRVKAKEYCEAAMKKFPDSKGAQNCRDLLEDIESVGIDLKMDQVLIPGQAAPLSLKYKNTTKLQYRIYKIGFREWKKFTHSRRDRKERLSKLKSREAYLSQKVDLPEKKDYQYHRLEMALPALEKGHYVIMCSSDFQLKYNQSDIRYRSFFVSNLDLHVRTKQRTDLEGYVLNRKSGEGIENANVRFVDISYNYSSRKLQEKVFATKQTNAEGYFEFPAENNKYRTFNIEVIKDDDRLMSSERFYQRRYNRADKKKQTKTYLFTDRSIYRPGQTVYFKGITLNFNKEQQNIKPGHETWVKLIDPNRQELVKENKITNEFGSFSGSFVLPSSGIAGRFVLKTPKGSTIIQVEEYKRPRFEVKLKKPGNSYKLGKEVSLSGHAEAYAGSKISNAKVSYEVVRKPQFIWRDYWYGYFQPYQPQDPVTIKTGQTETGQNGKFNISFMAIPGDVSRPGVKTYFQYKVKVDVTDINGETRSNSRSVSVGEKALVLDADLPGKVDQTQPMQYKLSAENLDGAGLSVKGDLTIERLKQPERLLKPRSRKIPDLFLMSEEEFREKFPHEQYKTELDKTQWEAGKKVFDCEFDAGEQDSLFMNCAADWEEGVYRLTMKAKDAFGQDVEKEKYFTLYNPSTDEMPKKTWLWSVVDKTTAEPGETVDLIVGSAAKNARIHMAYGMQGNILDKKIIKLSGKKQKLQIPVKDSMRGNFYIYLMMTREGITYTKKYKITVPYTNKELQTQLVTFRDKLKPGAKESWKIKLSGPEGEAVAAEMLASMYDASLDEFKSHQWSFDYLRYHLAGISISTRSGRKMSNMQWLSRIQQKYTSPKPYFRESLMGSVLGSFIRGGRAKGVYMMRNVDREEKVMEVEAMTVADSAAPAKAEDKEKEQDDFIRKDLSENAFFYPQLQTNKNGAVFLEFTMPESVTRWKFMTLSHTKDLKSDILTREVVTQKELMVMPNMPRFFRESDTISVSAKISNLTGDSLGGNARIVFLNPENREKISGKFLAGQSQKDFSVKSQGNTNVSWKLIIPEDYSAVTWRITAETEDHSDGVEDLLPVLSNRMLVTETMPLSVRRQSEKTYTMKKLLQSGSSSTLEHHRYTVEVTQNPAWYAVQALPYLSEYPHECSEQIFGRYYANRLAQMIVKKQPKIQNIFNIWRKIEPEALESQLEKNPELKSVMLSETPWVRDAKDEAQQKRRIGELFKTQNLNRNLAKTLAKLKEKQLNNGGWPWFGGKYANRYITQHIVAGFGHIHHLNAQQQTVPNKQVETMLRKAINYMDNQIAKEYKKLKEYGADLKKDHLNSIHAHYLYTRSFFSFMNIPLKGEVKKAYDYYYGQARKYWTGQSLYTQGMIALAMSRNDDKEAAKKIMASLSEKALHDEELGMYWRKSNAYYWSHAPIERQALMIEAYDEIMNDQKTVEELKLWLLKQKQTQSWESTKATAEAVYALLLKGKDLLTTGSAVRLKVGDEVVDPSEDTSVETEAGTGYFKESWSSVKPEMGKVTMTNKGENVSWGSVYWQYFEQLDKITGHDSPLSIEKELYKEIKTETGRKLKKLEGETTLEPGDRLTVRVVLSTDRDMEFVHLKDMRAAGLEPENVISEMKYQGGLAYYQSTKDAATHFFFDRLPKGKYVMEYSLFVAQQGSFSNGISTVQCMYAPEFSAHSKGRRVQVE